MSSKLNVDDWLETGSKKIECGVELELLLFNSKTKEPVHKASLTESILSKLPRQIYKDYYPYQLEIRTKPHSSPNKVINETKDLYLMASKEFMKEGIYIIPAPSITRTGFVYCGLHIHISYPNDRTLENYYKRAMGLYPFILSLADHTKNLEMSDIEMSDRIKSSHHIGTPFLDKDAFLNPREPNHKYRDLIYSPSNQSSSNRSRMKKPSTIELRLFDTPSLFDMYKFIVRYTMLLSSRIKTNNPMLKMLNKNKYDTINKLNMTRKLLIEQKYGVNKLFRMLNSDVCEDISKELKIDFPRETQFEFRERLGLSANVNGFLSMATKGGWLD
jgi:hypothetical protein